MYHTDLKDDRGTCCSIWIDLTKFPMPGESGQTDLGVSAEQLEFARMPILGDHHPGTYTTIYYPHYSFRFFRQIPKTLIAGAAAGHNFRTLADTIEDAFDLPEEPNFDTRPFHRIPQSAVVVSYPNDTTLGDRSIVHRNPGAGRYMLQFRSNGDLAYPLFRRLDLLRKHSDAILVTNATTRTVLRIG